MPPTGTLPAPPRYHQIDLMRGLAALSILFFHYPVFYGLLPGDSVNFSQRASMPFFAVLQPLYLRGHFAVQFFWVISGFVFAAVYGHQKTSGAEFARNRFARLYPLHLLTLMVMVGLQALSRHRLGHEQVYANNDWAHFWRHLFFVNGWSGEDGAFNGPTWSVSQELVIYAVFYASLGWLFRWRLWGPAALTVLFAGLARGRVPGVFWYCGFYFFMGVTLQAWSLEKRASLRACAWSGSALLLAFALIAGARSQGRLLGLPFQSFMPLLFVGLLLWALALEPLSDRAPFKKLRFLGDLTYGTYLWHVPVLALSLIVMQSKGIDQSVADHPLFMLAYLALVFSLARLTYVLVEKPARAYLRRA